MTPADRSLIDRMLTEEYPFAFPSNCRAAIRAQRDALEVAEERVRVLQQAVDTWEKVHENPGMDPHEQANEAIEHASSEDAQFVSCRRFTAT